MDKKEQYELEFPMNSSRGVLFNRLGTPEGLAEWFADDVRIEGDRYIFLWDDEEEAAFLLERKKDFYVRFQWEGEDDAYFQFRIEADEMNTDLTLIITDHAEPEGTEESKELWISQVERLKRSIGA